MKPAKTMEVSGEEEELLNKIRRYPQIKEQITGMLEEVEDERGELRTWHNCVSFAPTTSGMPSGPTDTTLGYTLWTLVLQFNLAVSAWVI